MEIIDESEEKLQLKLGDVFLFNNKHFLIVFDKFMQSYRCICLENNQIDFGAYESLDILEGDVQFVKKYESTKIHLFA